jgi:uncharacterized protein
MRAKDAPRLAVLRAVLADITNSTKTNQPVNNDILLLGLLRKRVAAAQQSVEQFYEADRKDLVATEEAQLRILEDYAGAIKTMSDSEIEGVLVDLVKQIREEKGSDAVTTADVMKRTSAAGSPFQGRMVSKGDIARIAKRVCQNP